MLWLIVVRLENRDQAYITIVDNYYVLTFDKKKAARFHSKEGAAGLIKDVVDRNPVATVMRGAEPCEDTELN